MDGLMNFWVAVLLLGGAGLAFVTVAVLTVGEHRGRRKRGDPEWKREDEGGDYTGWG